jgi:2-iminoacetate synthase
MRTFYQIASSLDWDLLRKEIYRKTSADVEAALTGQRLDVESFQALISPAAEPYLEQMAQLSRQITQKRFGKTIRLYIPLYLSNECLNHCIYCGFNHDNKIRRIILNEAQILAEMQVIKAMGYEHILLLTGESPQRAGVDYIEHAIHLAQPLFKQISIEVQPLETEEYRRLVRAGLYGVYIYQETYHPKRYGYYHPAGKKNSYRFRIETPDRLGLAQVHKIGLGALLGLEDWRVEAVFMAHHLRYLQKKYWQSRYSISFPRIRPHEGVFEPDFAVSDRQFAQMIWAFRIFDPDVEMSLTTRESPNFRNHMIPLGITSVSAGSRTEPGGYTQQNELEQFAPNDNRSPAEILQTIHQCGYEAVWKDWDYFQTIQ